MAIILRELKKLKPFRYTPGRKIDKYSKIESNVYQKLRVLKLLFENDIMNVIDRLKRNVPVVTTVDDDYDALFVNEFDESDTI